MGKKGKECGKRSVKSREGCKKKAKKKKKLAGKKKHTRKNKRGLKCRKGKGLFFGFYKGEKPAKGSQRETPKRRKTEKTVPASPRGQQFPKKTV